MMSLRTFLSGRRRTAIRVAIAVAFLALPFASPLATNAAHAQQKLRTVEGNVRNTAGQPVSGAVVYLKNSASLTVKTYVTPADGSFRFGQVAMDADFQVWAEADGNKSPVKNISSFDSRQLWTIPLKISAK